MNEELTAARMMAQRLGYVLEQDLAALCGITPGTAEAWRKRGRGPRYALVGNQYLYPEPDVKAWIESRTRDVTSRVNFADTL